MFPLGEEIIAWRIRGIYIGRKAALHVDDDWYVYVFLNQSESPFRTETWMMSGLKSSMTFRQSAIIILSFPMRICVAAIPVLPGSDNNTPRRFLSWISDPDVRMLPPGGCYLMFGLFFQGCDPTAAVMFAVPVGIVKRWIYGKPKYFHIMNWYYVTGSFTRVDFPDRRSSMRFQSGVDRGVVSCICWGSNLSVIPNPFRKSRIREWFVLPRSG